MAGMNALWTQLTDTKFLLMLGLGLFVLLLFARDRYNQPTYSDTNATLFGKLPPRLMAPKYRYYAGLNLYLVMMGTIYIVGSLIGPQIVAIPQFGVAKPWADATLWPLGVAAALTAVTASDDNSLLGRIEARLRRIAHEHALIPSEARALAQRLRNAPFKSWSAISNPEERKEIDALVVPISIEDVLGGSPSVDFRGHWIRANLIYHSIMSLEGQNRLGSVDEEMGAQRSTLDLKRANLSRLIKELPSAKDSALQSEINKQAVDFLESCASYFAFAVFQNSRNNWETGELLVRAGFSGVFVRKTSRTSSFLFALLSALVLAVIGSFLVIWAIYLIRAVGVTTFEILPSAAGGQYIWQLFCGAFSGILLYVVVFGIAHMSREADIRAKKWEENYGYVLKKVWQVAALCTSLLLCANILIVGQITPDSFISFVLFTAPMAAITGIFFFGYMKRAARVAVGQGNSEPRSEKPELLGSSDVDEPGTLNGSEAPPRKRRFSDLAQPLWIFRSPIKNWRWVFLHIAIAMILGSALSYLVSYIGAVSNHKPIIAQLETQLRSNDKEHPQESKELQLGAMAGEVSKIRETFSNPIAVPSSVELRHAKQKLERQCRALGGRVAKREQTRLFAQEGAQAKSGVVNIRAGQCTLDEMTASAVEGGQEAPAALPAMWLLGLANTFQLAAQSMEYSAGVVDGSQDAHLGKIAIVFGILSGALAAAFGTVVFGWRVYQLNTSFDAADAVRKQQMVALHDEEHVKGSTKLTFEDWLTDPLTRMSGLTRLEAMQYDEYEADFLPSVSGQHSGEGQIGQSEPKGRKEGMGEARSSLDAE